MIALIAEIGIGWIIAGVISWIVAISNQRQQWINALREDIADYFRQLELMHYAIGDMLSTKIADDLPVLEQKKRDARVATLFAYRQIQLRLNRNEELHIKLDEKLLELQRVETKTPDPVVLEETADLACRILRREWEATKWGPFVRLIRYWRGHIAD